jgi:hypothetical protein
MSEGAPVSSVCMEKGGWPRNSVIVAIAPSEACVTASHDRYVGRSRFLDCESGQDLPPATRFIFDKIALKKKRCRMQQRALPHVPNRALARGIFQKSTVAGNGMERGNKALHRGELCVPAKGKRRAMT